MGHPYSAVMVDRTRAIFIAALAGVVIFAAIGYGIEKSAWQPPFWLTTPSAGLFFGLFFGMYDRVLWRKSIFGFPLSQVPDLRGRWTGEISIEAGPRRREEQLLENIPCFVTVTQSWTRMVVRFETPFSTSVSSMAAILDGEFHYEYAVQPKVGTSYPKDMNNHGGMARMRFDARLPKRMSGHFFNDQNYQRFGRYELRRDRRHRNAESWFAAHQQLTTAAPVPQAP
ncbi:MAG TPA: hypothetical protein VFT50_11760 [Baekduia sp.]|nr:hypothetical protein [Baekduia sp.]